MLLLFFSLLFRSPENIPPRMKNTVIFIGSYSEASKDGIHAMIMLDKEPFSKGLRGFSGIKNPSFLKLSVNHQLLYAVSEVEDGTVQAYTVESADGPNPPGLSPAGSPQPAGNGPCHIAIDKQNRHLIVSNYGGGSLAVFPLDNNGIPRPAIQRLMFSGNGPNPSRQEAPHAHSAIFSPDGKQVLAADLGTDRIYVYEYDPGHTNRPLSPAKQPFATTAPGGGPRHMAFSADGKLLFVVLEMTGQIQTFRYQNGAITPLQIVSAAPPHYKGDNFSGADIHLSPDGKFLYSSLRGDVHHITILRVSGNELKIAGYQDLGGRKEPRNFCLSPNGAFLYCGLQKSGVVAIYKRNAETGLLTDTNISIEVPSPVCLEPMQ